MAGARDHWIRDVMSGSATGFGPTLLRGLLTVVEPGYRLGTAIRNKLFDRSILPARKLPKPVVSVGNLTTGGTGKTPTVTWLARRLQHDLGLHVAVLLRGYKRSSDAGSDEEILLRDALPGTTVLAHPNRYETASHALARGTPINAFVLDDGFQHRKLDRDFDLVLLDATNPFGYGHVLPRGMLREAPTALRRADAVLITRADLADPGELEEIEQTARRGAGRSIPVFRWHHQPGPVTIAGESPQPIGWLRDRRVFVIAGIGNPGAFERSLSSAGAEVVGRRFFADHHDYAQADVEAVLDAASSVLAELIVTTHKDRVKLQQIVGVESQVADIGMKLAYVDVSIAFEADHEARLFELIANAIQLPNAQRQQ
ncbi:MAG: tetraacyldisaccharide 4'-kinase [Tepidisphaeraceae bacterium]